LVLIDMTNSIHFGSGTVLVRMPVGRRLLDSGSNPALGSSFFGYYEDITVT
jgi:hypothetical protein